jgi:hypothetical protein
MGCGEQYRRGHDLPALTENQVCFPEEQEHVILLPTDGAPKN